MSSKKTWWALLSGASLAALSTIAPAQAQEVSDEIVVTATGRSAAIQDVPLAVTALSGEALENAGVSDLRDLQQVATSYKFYTGQSNTAGTTAYIRGIGTGADNPGFESAVGFFIDGVYRSRSGVALSQLPEIERVEVLRGPQGTLFGRNTTAGAISVVTAGPEFDPHYWMSGTAGDNGLAAANVGLTGPVLGSDTLAYRFDLSGQVRDGFITDVNTGRDLNDRNRWSARGQVLWDISPAASLRIIADYAETDEQCCVAVTFLAEPSPPAPGIPSAVMGIAALHNLRGLVLPADPESRQAAFTPGRDFTEQVEESGISAQLDWDLDNGMEFTSITAYRDWDALRDQDVDFSGIDRAYRDDYAVGFENFTQEFRLHGQHGRLDWLLGAFYGSETTNLTDTIRFGADAAAYIDLLAVGAQLAAGVPPGSVTSIYGTAVTPFPAADALFALTAPVPGEGQLDTYEVETTTMALFTHNEISLSDQLTLTVGVRYNQDEKDFSADISNIDLSPLPSSCQALQASLLAGSPPYANILALGPLLPLICSPAVNEQAVGAYNDTSEDNEFNGILSLAYDFTPDLMGYVSYSRGYKAGGYNLDRLGFNYALTGGPPITLPGTPPRQLDSTPDPTVEPSANDLQFDPEFVDAYEVGAKWTTWNGALTLNAAAFYEQITDYQNNAFTGFNFQTFNVPDTVSAGVELEWTARLTDQFTWQGGVLYNDAYIDSTVVLPGETITAGTPLDRAPDWTFTSALTYEQPISDNLVALFYVDGRWEGEQRLQVLGRDPRTDQESYALFNARVGIGPTDQRWSVEAFVDNLADEYYNLGAFAVPEQTSDGVGVYAVYPGQPRTWGVTVRARY